MEETDKKVSKANQVMVCFCPFCSREMVWLPIEPVNQSGADYVAYCIRCNKKFDVSAMTQK